LQSENGSRPLTSDGLSRGYVSAFSRSFCVVQNT